MLRQLSISNYALIDSLTVDFLSGLTAITGETGAGKSILLGALGFVLGDRTDTNVLLDKDKKCVVEAHFFLENDLLRSTFESNDLDFETECVFRRELNAQKKSRAFVNDTPVTLQQLKDLGSHLIDIHSQHDSLLLVDADFQLHLIDEMAQNNDLLLQYKVAFANYNTCRRQLTSLQEELKKSADENEFLTFQLDELKKADLKDDEYQEVQNRLQLIENSEQIKILLNSANQLMQGESMSLLDQLSELQSILQKLQKYIEGVSDLNNRVESSRIELKDIAFEIDRRETEMQFDEEELQILQERIDLINRLMFKHHVNDYSELLDIRNSLQAKIDAFAVADTDIERLKKEMNNHISLLTKIATALHQRRLSSIASFEKTVTDLVHLLAMPHGVFKVNCESNGEFGKDGTDKVSFLFSANKGVAVDDIAHVSGGEMSRLMLAIKSALSHCNYIPTLIFDEIDTGVSGAVASKVANIMKDMAADLQVIAITHLPQIASAASCQLLVYKDDTADKTHTRLKILNHEERILEIAKMMSNDSVSDEAIRAAQVLLS